MPFQKFGYVHPGVEEEGSTSAALAELETAALAVAWDQQARSGGGPPTGACLCSQRTMYLVCIMGCVQICSNCTVNVLVLVYMHVHDHMYEVMYYDTIASAIASCKQLNDS